MIVYNWNPEEMMTNPGGPPPSGDGSADAERLARIRHAARLAVVGRLAPLVSHDLNNRLTAVITTADLMSMDVEPGSEAAADLDEIGKAGRAAVDLSKILALFVGGSLSSEGSHIGSALRPLEPLLRRLVPAGVNIALDVSPETPPVPAAEAAIREIVLLLFDNAKDAVGREGSITVGAKPGVDADGRGVAVLLVSDTGVWPEELGVREAFQPFRSTKAPTEAAGLGLTSAAALVQSLGGSIAIESSHSGTTVRVTLPPHSERS